MLGSLGEKNLGGVVREDEYSGSSRSHLVDVGRVETSLIVEVVCFVHFPSHECHKLFAQSVKCAFMGYSVSHKGYVCYNLCSNKFRISCHVVFFENQSFFSTHVKSLLGMLALPNFDELNPTQERFNPEFVYQRRRPTFPFREPDLSPEPVPIDYSIVNSTSDTIPRQFSRLCHPPDRYGFSNTSLNTTLASIPIPTCHLEAVKHDCWRVAMAEELQALKDNHKWDVVQCLTNVKAIGCK